MITPRVHISAGGNKRRDGFDVIATSHLARGAVRFLHWKDKTRTSRRKEVCRAINANVSARLILGLSKCGMHGEEPVRLKRLKRPWVDED